ncbi:alpha/beta fold hydrolase [Anaerococcus tetradius]|uniref:alpha/beta fold hydrolase n=1 Tax=Anaerococcus tetradius TaxID=33036 RepID=UPI0023F363D1|nr:alpha/beta hydrolase [Anaerococcus tetradius]
MNFLSYGDKNKRALLFIHGLSSTYDLCFGQLIPYLNDYYLIFSELDGHSPTRDDDMLSLEDNIDRLEAYIISEMGGRLYGICGFSMGATIAVELISRGNISVEKVLLDGAVTSDLGLMALPYTWAFIIGTERIKKAKPIPKFLLDWMLGKDNRSVIEMMYDKISKRTIRNALKYLYHYQISESLKNFTKPVLFWRGSEEPIAKKSEENLKKYISDMKSEVFEGLGHGQFLHEHPNEYSKKLRKFLEED